MSSAESNKICAVEIDTKQEFVNFEGVRFKKDKRIFLSFS